MSEQPDYLILPLGQLAATTPRELAQVLRRVAVASARERKALAIAAGVPRGQLYRLIDPDNDAMPRNPDQLKGLLRACRLHPVLVNAVLLQWHLIRQGRKKT